MTRSVLFLFAWLMVPATSVLTLASQPQAQQQQMPTTQPLHIHEAFSNAQKELKQLESRLAEVNRQLELNALNRTRLHEEHEKQIHDLKQHLKSVNSYTTILYNKRTEYYRKYLDYDHYYQENLTEARQIYETIDNTNRYFSQRDTIKTDEKSRLLANKQSIVACKDRLLRNLLTLFINDYRTSQIHSFPDTAQQYLQHHVSLLNLSDTHDSHRESDIEQLQRGISASSLQAVAELTESKSHSAAIHPSSVAQEVCNNV